MTKKVWLTSDVTRGDLEGTPGPQVDLAGGQVVGQAASLQDKPPRLPTWEGRGRRKERRKGRGGGGTCSLGDRRQKGIHNNHGRIKLLLV